MVCARLKPAVSGLEQEFPNKVSARNVDASDPERTEEIRRLGFATHGLVIRSKDGATLFKQADHRVDMSAVESAIRQILAKPS
jgi:hypothetical protein